MFEEAYLQWPIAVNWNDNTLWMAFFNENVVTAVNAFENPPMFLDDANEFFARNLFHTVNSRISSSSKDSVG